MKQRNQIYMLKNAEGERVDNSSDIEDIILSHFENIYNNNQIPDMNNTNQLSENIDLVI